MPVKITAYQVLLELPGGLEEERRAFSDIVHAFNDLEAIPRNVLFIPVGWETEGGPPADLTGEDLATVDYFVLLLWDRWPAGLEEEYDLATGCLRDPDRPMMQVLPFFKSLPPSEPGEQFQRVLRFRETLESQNEILFEAFDTIEGFKIRLQRHLSRWLLDHERSLEAAEPAPPPREPSPVDAAFKKADEGGPRRWKPHPLDEAPGGFNRYGLFLQREGLWDDAEVMHLRALEAANQESSHAAMAIAYGNLGAVYHKRNDLDEAEKMFQSALEISERLGSREGMAASHSGLGVVYTSRDDLEEAEKAFRRALEIEKELGRQEGLVACYGHLEVVYRRLHRLDKAEEMRSLAREFLEALAALFVAGRADRHREADEESVYPFGNLFPGRI